MKREQVLRFRLARHGLATERRRISPAEAAACPASNFNRMAALLAIAARAEGITREGFDADVDAGGLIMAPAMRSAIHAFAPDDFSNLGRGLVGTDEKELTTQLGQGASRSLEAVGMSATDALEEVTEATEGALANGRKLDKNDLHQELRERVREELLPWCKGCKSHHVAPGIWRYAGVVAGVRRDSEARYLIGHPKPKGKPDPAGALRLFLRFYGPATQKQFAGWAGVPGKQAKRIWEGVEDELVVVVVGVEGEADGHLLAGDEAELGAAEKPDGLRMLPPGDPYLASPDRKELIPDAELRKRIFRPVVSPGVVLLDGRIAGLWKVKAKGKRSDFSIEELRRLPRKRLEAEAERIGELRKSAGIELSVG